MTRINVVPAPELSDAWLLAEYRELPRVLKQPVNITDAPARYQLGTGHVKWARKHGVFVCKRMDQLVQEMCYRGFCPTYTRGLRAFLTPEMLDYTVTAQDLQLNRARLKHKYQLRPHVHVWTRRVKPTYLRETLSSNF